MFPWLRDESNAATGSRNKLAKIGQNHILNNDSIVREQYKMNPSRSQAQVQLKLNSETK